VLLPSGGPSSTSSTTGKQLRWNECFIDGSFAPAKKGAPQIGPTKRGKGTKWMVLVDGAGTPVGAYLDAASPAEVTLLEKPLASQPIRGTPEHLIGDRGYDSNAVRRFLKRRRIQPIIPARSNNTQATDQDGRCLRRYRRRWIIERTIGWLGNFRRLTVRYDRLLATYGASFTLLAPCSPSDEF
jgi:transposase